MSVHSYSRCWLLLVWGTLTREKALGTDARVKVARFLLEYAHSKNILLRSVFVNSDHVHALIDLPTGVTIEESVQLLKGASSHWINQNSVVAAKFSWGRGYGAFSVSESNLSRIVEYIAGQDEHHRVKSFQEEYAGFLRAVGIQPNEAENR